MRDYYHTAIRADLQEHGRSWQPQAWIGYEPKDIEIHPKPVITAEGKFDNSAGITTFNETAPGQAWGCCLTLWTLGACVVRVFRFTFIIGIIWHKRLRQPELHGQPGIDSVICRGHPYEDQNPVNPAN